MWSPEQVTVISFMILWSTTKGLAICSTECLFQMFLKTVYEYILVWNVLPRKVFEMYSETWFPDRLISERCVNSRFSILLNCWNKINFKKLTFFWMLFYINLAVTLLHANPQTRYWEINCVDIWTQSAPSGWI